MLGGIAAAERPFVPVTRDVLVQALEGAGLRSVVRRLDHVALPSLRLKTRRIDPDKLPLGANRVGGCPDLPRHARWPTEGGEPLSFVAQVRCADVAWFKLSRHLPRDGMLAFFFDATLSGRPLDNGDPRGSFRVLWVDELSTLTRRATPRALEEPMRSFPWCAVSFHEEVTLPPVAWLDPDRTPSPVAGEDFLPRADYGRYTDLRRRLYHPSQLGHRVAGYPVELAPADHRVLAATRGGTATPAGALGDHVSEWQLVLQVDSDPAAEMTWGDAGRLSFWARGGDLVRRDLDHAWCVLEG